MQCLYTTTSFRYTLPDLPHFRSPSDCRVQLSAQIRREWFLVAKQFELKLEKRQLETEYKLIVQAQVGSILRDSAFHLAVKDSQ